MSRVSKWKCRTRYVFFPQFIRFPVLQSGGKKSVPVYSVSRISKWKSRGKKCLQPYRFASYSPPEPIIEPRRSQLTTFNVSITVEGCRLFPDEPCPSWFGVRHVPCRAGSNSSSSDLGICTLEKFNYPGKCRDCENVSEWRCDSGQCIPSAKVQDGLKDCKDGTDEDHCE